MQNNKSNTNIINKEGDDASKLYADEMKERLQRIKKLFNKEPAFTKNSSLSKKNQRGKFFPTELSEIQDAHSGELSQINEIIDQAETANNPITHIKEQYDKNINNRPIRNKSKNNSYIIEGESRIISLPKLSISQLDPYSIQIKEDIYSKIKIKDLFSIAKITKPPFKI